MVMPDFPAEPIPELTPEEKLEARKVAAKASVEAYALMRVGNAQSDLIGAIAERITELETRIAKLEKP